MTYDIPTEGPQQFGARLRAHRERRQISIATIAESTKILGALLEGLERGDVSRWPTTGFYRRSFIRAYAIEIGLPPEPVVREFLEHYPDPEVTPILMTVAVPPRRAPGTVLRLTLADSVSPYSLARLIGELPRRASAVALDLFILGVSGLGLFLALDVFWAPMAIVAVSYSCASTLLLGQTPGSCLFASASKAGSSGVWAQARRRLASLLPRAPQWTETPSSAQPEADASVIPQST